MGKISELYISKAVCIVQHALCMYVYAYIHACMHVCIMHCMYYDEPPNYLEFFGGPPPPAL